MAVEGDLSLDALDGLTVLDLVIKEALRLVAPVPSMARKAVKDTELLGHFIPAGTQMSVSPWFSHYMPEIWTDPMEFDPDAFAEPRREDKKHRFAWVPFGGGAHKCIGMYFGTQEVKTLLHHLLRNYRWTTPPGYQVPWDLVALPMPATDCRFSCIRCRPHAPRLVAMSLDVLDWRRQVFELYREVRAHPDPAVAHAMWRTRREELVGTTRRRPTGRRPPPRAVRRRLRFDVAVDTDVEPNGSRSRPAPTASYRSSGSGGSTLDGVGSLDVWWLDSYGGGVWLPFRDRVVRDLRRRPIPARHGEGRRSRRRRRAGWSST